MAIKTLLVSVIVAIMSLANADTAYFDRSGKQITKEEYENLQRTVPKRTIPTSIPNPPAALTATPKQTKSPEPKTYSIPTPLPTIKHKTVETENIEHGTGLTVEDHVACFFKNHIEDMITFASAKDKASFNAYIKQKKCIILKGNDKVTIMEYPGMFGGYTKIAYHGVNLWTTRDGVKFR